LKQF
jgi:phasin family protein